MATKSKSSFQKRQKEMKRQEKQRMKAERRAQKKLTNRAERDATLLSSDSAVPTEMSQPGALVEPTEPQP